MEAVVVLSYVENWLAELKANFAVMIFDIRD
jgi:hypothetical protein